MKEPVQLGPFSVEEKIGAGGMSVVYRGVHRRTGVPVAVKVVLEATEERIRRWFREEVQAHAGLVHPGIVYLFEHGVIGEEVAGRLGSRIVPDSPYVAMELADRGTVRDLLPAPNWPAARRVLVQILDALAHAHAREVIHRDLKPENFLVFERSGESEGGYRIKLADFGVAHALGREYDAELDESGYLIGTPRYMPPEQLRGEWRQYGPWTDIYSIGCIAWELVCGRPPFEGDTTLSVIVSHQDDDRPELDPQFPVPEELERWIHRAMAIEPNRRFQRAADAVWALPGAAEVEVEYEDENKIASEERVSKASAETIVYQGRAGASVETELLPEMQTVTLTEFALRSEHRSSIRSRGESSEEQKAGEAGGDGEPWVEEILESQSPPVPETWRREEIEPIPMPLADAGLGLFGLREPPFVNREVECDRMWELLRRVVDDGIFELAVLRGRAGTGKSRVVERIVTRAHEVGAARVLRAVHTASGGLGDGLRGAFQRMFRTAKLDRLEVYEHLLEELGPDPSGDEGGLERDARALTEYLRPSEEGAEGLEGPRYRFESAREKWSLVVRVLRRLGRRRPILLWLDDLHWGAGSLGFLEHLHSRNVEEFPLFVIGTLRSDMVGERPAVERRINRLQSVEAGTWMELEPLSRLHQREFLDAILTLEDDLADRLTERTEGHPLFAIQLLAHWSEEGALEVGGEGFRLREDRIEEVPENVHELWIKRVGNVVDSFEERPDGEVLEALELAAALGREVRNGEWREVLEHSEIEFLPELVDRLVERGLAERTDEGWVFTHGLFVESVERRARDGGRWLDHHRRCARALETILRADQVGAWERIADHWVEAGEPERALEPLKRAAQEAKQMWNYPRLSAMLGRRRDVLDEVGVGEVDRRRIENDIESAWSKMHLWTPPEEVIETLQEARDRAAAHDDHRLIARAWKNLARCHRQTGAYSEARRCGREAAGHARACGDSRELAWALGQLGWAEYHLGNLDAAEEWFSETREVAAESGLTDLERACGYPNAVITLSRGEVDRAEEMFESLWEAYRETRNDLIMFYVLTGRAEIARFQREMERAEAIVQRQHRLVRRRSLGPECVVQVFLNSSFVALGTRRFKTAIDDLSEAEERADQIPHFPKHYHPSLTDLHLGNLACAAGVGDWGRFDALVESAPTLFPEDCVRKRNHPWLLEMAGAYAEEFGEEGRAREVRRLAGELREELDS